MLIRKYVFTSAIFMFLISGCISSPVIMVKAGSGEQTITAKAGKPFSVQLQSQMSTGYSWKLAEAPGTLKIIKEAVITDGKDITGGIDIQEFVFKSSEKGDLTLTFRYAQHWKNSPEYIKTSVVRVKIE